MLNKNIKIIKRYSANDIFNVTDAKNDKTLTRKSKGKLSVFSVAKAERERSSLGIRQENTPAKFTIDNRAKRDTDVIFNPHKDFRFITNYFENDRQNHIVKRELPKLLSYSFDKEKQKYIVKTEIDEKIKTAINPYWLDIYNNTRALILESNGICQYCEKPKCKASLTIPAFNPHIARIIRKEGIAPIKPRSLTYAGKLDTENDYSFLSQVLDDTVSCIDVTEETIAEYDTTATCECRKAKVYIDPFGKRHNAGKADIQSVRKLSLSQQTTRDNLFKTYETLLADLTKRILDTEHTIKNISKDKQNAYRANRLLDAQCFHADLLIKFDRVKLIVDNFDGLIQEFLKLNIHKHYRKFRQTLVYEGMTTQSTRDKALAFAKQKFSLSLKSNNEKWLFDLLYELA